MGSINDKTFWGYNSLEQAKLYWPIPEELIITTMVRCATKPDCVAGLEGHRFLYADGTEDQGVLKPRYHVIMGNNKIAWR